MQRAFLHRSVRERALRHPIDRARKRALLLLLPLGALLFASCVDDVPLPAGSDLQTQGSLVIPAHCPPPVDGAPRTLECTGLYSDLVAKTVAEPVRPFTPGMHLWSDGAGKQRWLYLPPGTTIDNSKPYWTFPVGTRAWKEFKHGDQRVETRYFEKTEPSKWVKSTYLWRDGESAADIFAGGDVPVSDGTYHVPTHEECEQCHNRNKLNRDSLLGVEPVLLGLPTADGYTLAALVAEGRLTVPPSRTQVQIPDDGTGKGAAALGYLHVNCGISCHNDDGSANISHMFLRIYPAQLEDPSSAGWDLLKNTINVPPVTPNFGTAIRIVPGAPDDSLIVQLANTRGSSRAMPPIASRVTDPDGLQLLRDWIAAMGGDGGVPDGGVSDGGNDGGSTSADAGDAGVPDDAGVSSDAGTADDAGSDADTTPADTDAGGLDGSVDAGELDAGSPDAMTEDAGLDDVTSPDAEDIDTATATMGDDAQAPDAAVESAAADLSSDAANDDAFASDLSDADEPDGA